MPSKNKTKAKRKYTKRDKAVASPYFSSFIPGGSPFLDQFGKTHAPTPMELVIQCLDIAYACASLNSESVASTPLKLYVKTTRRHNDSKLMKRGDTRAISSLTLKRLKSNPMTSHFMQNAKEVEEVTEHPALTLLDNPLGKEDNSTAYNRFMLFEAIERYLEIVGRSYLWVEQNGPGGTPSALWVIPSHLMVEWPDMSQEKVIKEYQYLSGINKTTYSPEEIIPFRFIDLSTGGYLGGFSPLRACFESVRLFRLFSAHINATLLNSGRPAAMWSPSGTEGYGIGDVEAKRMVAAVKQTFSQAGAGGLWINRMPGTLEPLQWPTDQLLSSQQWEQTRTSVANCFGVPTTKINRADSTLASAKTGDWAHAKDAILPRLRRIEAVLNQFYLKYWDKNNQLFFAYEQPEALIDDAAEFERWKGAAAGGAITRNEERTALGLEPVVWGDVPLSPSNMVATDKDTGLPMPISRITLHGDADKGAIASMGDREEALDDKKPNKGKPEVTEDDEEVEPELAEAEEQAETKSVKTLDEPVNIVNLTAAIIKLQQEVFFGNISREQGIATAQVVFHMNEEDAIKIFPEKKEPEHKAIETVEAIETIETVAQTENIEQKSGSEGSSEGGGYVTPVDTEEIKKKPEPEKDESKEEYVSRCVKVVMGEGKTQEQALGQCYGMWNEAHPHSEKQDQKD